MRLQEHLLGFARARLWENAMPEEPHRGVEPAGDPPADAQERSTETQATPRMPTAIPKMIGQFHVKGVIASGGMGTVYEAVQEHPRRTVALKVMRRGIVSRAARRRFEYESQLLARLHHPGIAQVYEAGMHEDPGAPGEPVPYFAMEYIPNARPITEFAKKKLGTRQRLGLFAHVCEAVHHGHQKGIIHRDLKPGNILVDSHGEVKIIDFGVARSTDSDMAVTTQQTAVGELIGTLKYMSPEQCEADPHDIDTRSDVYALGVVLYELLSGQLPYDLTATPVYEVPRVIREVSATRLSTLDKTLRGDVETIVGKALEKDRERRYQSAVALAEDVKRHLNHEPILARPPSVVYRFSKFVRRRRVPLAVAAMLLVAVVVTGDRQLKVRRLHVKATNAALAVARAAAGEMAETMSDLELRDAQRVIAECTTAIELQPDLAMAYALRGRALMREERYDDAWEDCTRALELDPENSLALRTLGFLYLNRGEFPRALAAYDRGIKALQKRNLYMAEDFHSRARLHQVAGNYPLALADHDRAVALAPPDVGIVYLGRGITRRFDGNVEGAIEDLSHAASLEPSWFLQCSQWIWEMRMLRGDPGDRKAAEAALARAEEEAKDVFEKTMIGVCRGHVAAEEALAAANTDKLRCWAYYYLGARALVEGRRTDAKALFQQCYDMGADKLAEHDLSRWHLQQLGAD